MGLFILLVLSLVALQTLGKVQYDIKPVRCSKCPPGWGVAERCTQHQDTVCEKCEHGKSYSPHHSSTSACWLCSQCGIGLYETQRCSPQRDTICNECITFIGQKNFIRRNDFDKKCSYLFIGQHKTWKAVTGNLDGNR